MREIVTAASAAGVAVAFGSPIGGVMFSIEVCTAQHPFKGFELIVFTGNEPYF